MLKYFFSAFHIMVVCGKRFSRTKHGVENSYFRYTTIKKILFSGNENHRYITIFLISYYSFFNRYYIFNLINDSYHTCVQVFETKKRENSVKNNFLSAYWLIYLYVYTYFYNVYMYTYAMYGTSIRRGMS